jgi:hypothetical protein
MVKKKTARKNKPPVAQVDGVYLLKMILYVVLGAQWLWLYQANGQRLPVPIGLLVGILFAMHDHFQIDRKIEYAVLLVAMLVGFVATIGIEVTV